MPVDISAFAAFARRVGAVPRVPRAVAGEGYAADDPRTAGMPASAEIVPLVPRVPHWLGTEAVEERTEAFEERAAIAEYEGGLPRPHAEVLAALHDLSPDPASTALLDAVARRLCQLAAAGRLR